MPEQELREQIARIVDPRWWYLRDLYLPHVSRERANLMADSSLALERRGALFKADQIIALLPKDEWRTEDGIPGSPSSPPSGRPETQRSDGGEERGPSPYPIGTRNNGWQVGWRAHLEGRARDACPFPRDRRDLRALFEEGWDAAAVASTSHTSCDRPGNTGRTGLAPGDEPLPAPPTLISQQEAERD
jgi:ribosome modulation factor